MPESLPQKPPKSQIVRIFCSSSADRRITGTPAIPHNSDWRALFRRVRTCIDRVEHDPIAGGKVLSKIRAEFGNDGHGSFVSSTRHAFMVARKESCTLSGRTFTPDQVLCLALIGHREATVQLAEALLIEAERGVAKRSQTRTDRSTEQRNDSTEDIPEWAKPERSFLLEWAEVTIDKKVTGLVDDIAHFVAGRIKKGGVNVLVFDAELYAEVVNADIVGKGAGKIEEFPFPLTVIRMPDTPGVYGAVVFRRQDFRRKAVTEVGRNDKYADGYEIAYVLDGGGVTLDPSSTTTANAERLTTYLDCDNAMIETVYVDGGTPKRNNSPKPKEEASEYVRGADFIVGTQVVVERGRQPRGAKKIIKRAHFRRGFYKRQRIGPRDDWHYETRWIKPTFVHGSESIITERRVKVIVL